MALADDVEKIYLRMFRRRFSQDSDIYAKWNVVRMSEQRPKKARDIITEFLAAGHTVSAGHYCTSVRGFHEHLILWR